MIFLFTILLIINFVVTYKLLKDEYYDKRQKTIQIFIIWLIPLVGALIVFLFLNREEKGKDNPSSGGINPSFYDSAGTSSGGGD